jgi:hypothetical protein
MRWRRTLIIAAIAAAPGTTALAQPNNQRAAATGANNPLVKALEACRQIPDPAQRVACYDAASSALVNATAKGDVRVVDQSEVRRARRSLFGFSLPRLPWFSGDDSQNEPDDRLDSTIKSAWLLTNVGRYRIVLADDAVWETTESKINWIAPRPGQKITILKGVLGNYFLQIDGQVGLRGRRIS